MKRVKVLPNIGAMCQKLFDDGRGFEISNGSILPNKTCIFTKEMHKFLGQEIELNNDSSGGYYFSPYMYTEITPSFRQFKDILEIPEGAIFREKKCHTKMFKITNQFDSTGNIIFCCGSSGMSGKVLIDDCEMTIDKGENWTVAGVEE
jgi:hypothetical protein